MTWLLGVLAIACVVYYVIIILYSGFATSFSFVWLLMAGFLFLLAAGTQIYKSFPKKMPLWMPVSAITFCAAGAVIFVIVEILIFSGAASVGKPHLDYLIVLGASIREDEMSSSLQRRLDKAIEYVQANPETILVLSGGKGQGERVTEAEAMYEYLTFNGVPENMMILETVSHSTVENIAYSRVAIEKDQERKKIEQQKLGPVYIPGALVIDEEKPLEIGVLTSNFHVFRAEQIAKKWGIPEIHGVASSSDPVLFVHFSVRECAAILKDKLMGNM